MKVLILKNITREGPGLITEILKNYNIGCDIVNLNERKKIPDCRNYSALFEPLRGQTAFTPTSLFTIN